jgi:hypothetical protein
MTRPARIELLTMCDLRFLPQALVLHRSLERHGGDFRLRVLCLDEETGDWLARASLGGVETIPLASLEARDPGLAVVRSSRTWHEYCWTATPVACHLALQGLRDDHVLLWVDADLEFLRDPRTLLDELGDGSILLTPHEYYRTDPTSESAAFLTETWGRFNGGTVAFRRDDQGLAAAALWRSRSLRWCHNRLEPGRFGNQLHLVDFPDRFAGTRILRVPGGGIGPWNAGRYRIASNGHGVTADGRPVTFYHHQSLRLHRRPRRLRWLPLPSNVFRLPGLDGGLVGRTNPRYRISREDRRLVWDPYVRRLSEAVADVDGDGAAYDDLRAGQVRRDAERRLRIGAARVRHGMRPR